MFKIINKTLIGGSLILLITINLFSLLNFIFNISMARMLSLANYGILTALISIIVIFTVFSESIQTIISKYSTKEKDYGKLKNIIKKSFKKTIPISIFLYFLFLLAAIPISHLLEIKYPLLSLIGLMIFAYFLLPITRGVMQGMKKFTSLGTNMIFEGVIKLVIAIALVSLGWNVYGAIGGVLLGTLGALFLSFFSLRKIISSKEEQSKTPDIYAYSKPVFITMVSIILFLSLDIILAKLFFPLDTVGAYAIASTIAKMIFIGTYPISKAMFPFTTEIKNNKDSQKAFLNSFALIGILILIAILIMALFPNLIVRLYSGREILAASQVLFYLSIAIGLLSFTNLVLFYNLSRGKTKSFYFLLFFIAFEILLLSIFNHNLLEFSIAFITASATFLWGAVFLLNK